VFWPRVRARALRAPVFLGSLTRQKGRCAPPTRPSQLRCFFFFKNKKISYFPKQNASLQASYSSKIKITYFPKQNASLQAQTRAARDVYLSTGLSFTLLCYIAPY
jgi:hypothetical protein